jgi:plasmid stabilization system protein ParE
MSQIHYSRSAAQDRQSILEFTVEHFGLRQAWRLRDRMESSLLALADAPQLGSLRQEPDPPGHTFRYFVVSRSFVVVYEPVAGGIRVARLIHGARNLTVELELDAGDQE